MFGIILDNSLKLCEIIFEMFEDYVAEVKILYLRRMFGGLKHYNLLF